MLIDDIITKLQGRMKPLGGGEVVYVCVLSSFHVSLFGMNDYMERPHQHTLTTVFVSPSVSHLHFINLPCPALPRCIHVLTFISLYFFFALIFICLGKMYWILSLSLFLYTYI